MFKIPWNLSDLKNVPKNGLKVFSCFHCGGGSTMGYKLAGYDVLGGVEIDPQMMSVYRENHHPQHSFLMGVQDFNKIPLNQIPYDLFDLDILDGSPPCSSFSMAGSREKAWGVKKKFREGQSEQVLDDLFFHFIETARRLQPKVVIAENVKGLIIGKAKGYVKQIAEAFNHAGYELQLFLLNAAFMGVPQKRERAFFIAKRKGLGLNPLKLSFTQTPMTLEQAFSDLTPLDTRDAKPLSKIALDLWSKVSPGQGLNEAHPKGSWFSHRKSHPQQPSDTIIAGTATYHWKEPRYLSAREITRIQSFPDDYNFNGIDAQYICGMSVPPIMMAHVAKQIELQWLSKINRSSNG